MNSLDSIRKNALFRIENLLNEYSKELFGSDSSQPLSVEKLIELHRKLRAERAAADEQREKVLEDARQQAYKDAHREALKSMFFSADQLRKMTIEDLVEELQKR